MSDPLEEFGREVRPPCQLYLISPLDVSGGFADRLARALDAGPVAAFQFRVKGVDQHAAARLAEPLLAICRAADVAFIVNDDMALAKRLGADGVHLGQEDMDPAEARRILGPDAIIGVSAHNVAEAKAAVAAGADYLGCGAMFATTTKTNVTALPKETLRAICAAVPVPVVAIGGISKQNLLSLAHCGEAGVALVSAIFAAEDIEKECRELRRLAAQL